jgi:hypothetical protein
VRKYRQQNQADRRHSHRAAYHPCLANLISQISAEHTADRAHPNEYHHHGSYANGAYSYVVFQKTAHKELRPSYKVPHKYYRAHNVNKFVFEYLGVADNTHLFAHNGFGFFLVFLNKECDEHRDSEQHNGVHINNPLQCAARIFPPSFAAAYKGRENNNGNSRQYRFDKTAPSVKDSKEPPFFRFGG